MKSTWMRLPPHRYPGYYSLPSMVMEKAIADWTVLAVIKVVKGHSRKTDLQHPLSARQMD